MQTNNRLFDDLAKMAGGAFTVLTGAKNEMEAALRTQMENFLGTMNLVSREEFDAVRAVATKAREQQEALESRVAFLEAVLRAAAAAQTAPATEDSTDSPATPAAAEPSDAAFQDDVTPSAV